MIMHAETKTNIQIVLLRNEMEFKFDAWQPLNGHKWAIIELTVLSIIYVERNCVIRETTNWAYRLSQQKAFTSLLQLRRCHAMT